MSLQTSGITTAGDLERRVDIGNLLDIGNGHAREKISKDIR